MGFSLLFDIIYVTLQSYYYQIIIVDMKKTLLTLAIMAATATTANAENLFKTLLGKTGLRTVHSFISAAFKSLCIRFNS